MTRALPGLPGDFWRRLGADAHEAEGAQGEEGREEVRGHGDGHGAAEAELTQEHPGRDERTEGGAQKVGAVERTHARDPAPAVDAGPSEEGQRHAHESRGHDDAQEMEERRSNRRVVKAHPLEVEEIVEHGNRDRAEDGDGELDACEGPKGAAGPEAGREQPARPAPEAQAGHERADDHGYRIEPGPAVEGQDALPTNLVDQGGCTAEEESSDDQREWDHDGEQGSIWS